MIYALLDIDMLEKYGVSIDEFVDECKKLNVEMIQYRDKNSPMDMKKDLISEVREAWSKTLIVNDFIELIDYADGLHIGQDDLKKYGSIESIREKIGDKLLGLSTHNLKEIQEANNLNVDYIGLGAYAKTSTKTDAKTLGKRKTKKLIPYSNKKIAVIGGVKLSDKVKGASYLVVGSDICKSISTQ
jgi:thiamine-phosphate pyrophosphorylase